MFVSRETLWWRRSGFLQVSLKGLGEVMRVVCLGDFFLEDARRHLIGEDWQRVCGLWARWVNLTMW